MNVERFVQSIVGVVLVTAVWPSGVFAQDGHSHAASDQKKAGALVQLVREST